MGKIPVGRDIFDRVLWTFVVTVLGLATADGVDLQNVLSLGNWKTWVTAGVVAAFTLLKASIGNMINGRGGAIDPAVKLAPVDDLRPR